MLRSLSWPEERTPSFEFPHLGAQLPLTSVLSCSLNSCPHLPQGFRAAKLFRVFIPSSFLSPVTLAWDLSSPEPSPFLQNLLLAHSISPCGL